MTQFIALLVLAAWIVPLAAAGGGIVIHDPWIRGAPPTAPSLAGYMKIQNTGKAPRVLVGAKVEGFGHVMIHRTVDEAGMARMVHQDRITVPADGSVSFAPGGYHLMLMQPESVPDAGATVNGTLQFEDGSEVAVEFTVRRQ